MALAVHVPAAVGAGATAPATSVDAEEEEEEEEAMVLSLLHLVAADDQHCSNNGAYGPRNDCSDDGSSSALLGTRGLPEGVDGVPESSNTLGPE